jgi:glycosyltransferase involved in cell wall biosynthesis
MRIAQIAPPWYHIPPPGYGGIERVIYDLTEGLQTLGCEVILCAPDGSQTSAKLIPSVPRPIGMDFTEAQKSRYFTRASRDAYRSALDEGADLIHDHTDYTAPRDFPLPVVRTIHGPATVAAVTQCRKMSKRGDYLVAISHRQRELFEEEATRLWGSGHYLNFIDVIHNPIDVGAAPFYPASKKRGYVAYLGRCHWEKSPDGAIRVAQAAGVPLMMALRVTSEERPYFEAVVEPLARSIKNFAKPVGEVDGRAKDELIGFASAVIFPSPWEEPFGLVLTESGARGTPVVALNRGAAPEIVVDGVTGVLCADEDEMAQALPRAMKLDPVACREHIAANFDRPLIAQKYLEVYQRILNQDADKRSRELAKASMG